MIDVTIKIPVSADKRSEVLITAKGLLSQIRHDQGCISCHCYQDIESEDVVVFKQEWETSEDFDAHLRSGHFKVLLGAMKLLSIEPKISFSTVVATKNVETKVGVAGE